MLDIAAKTFADDLLGDLVQICFVTRDFHGAMDRLRKLGIGPFRCQSWQPDNVQQARFRGHPHAFSCNMAYAHSANIMWEVVQPVDGTDVFSTFLDEKGEGVHHLGFDCGKRPFADAIAAFEARGYQIIQTGRVWDGKVGYAFIGTHDDIGCYLEIWDHPADFAPPEPQYRYPAAPVAAELA